MSNNILEVKNLSVLIKERFLVKNVTFSLEKGKTLAIIGEDRSGKTSLIKAIDGALPISQGQILIDGKDIKLNREVLSDVSLCLDPPMFFKFQSVYENMKYLTSLSNKFDKEKIKEVLEKVGLSDKIKTKVLFLSYFEKKLLSLTLAFLVHPKLMLLDQPFKALPVKQIELIKNWIRQLQKEGTTVIISSTKYENVSDFCDQFIFMEHRQLVKMLTHAQCEKFTSKKTYAFIEAKYPHYAGKVVIDEFGLDVKILVRKLLFEADEDKTAEIVKFLSKKKIKIFKAGFLQNKAEKIFAELAPFYKKEEVQE